MTFHQKQVFKIKNRWPHVFWTSVLTLFICVFVFIFGSNQALAATISVDGVSYNVQFTSGESFTDNQALLLDQNWWGDSIRAEAFRDAYYDSYFVENVPFDWDSSATENTDRLFFAYEALGPVPGGGVRSAAIQDIYSRSGTGYDAVGQSATDSSGVAIHYAYVSAASVPEINSGSLSQVLLILFALWLVVTRRYKSLPV